MATILGDVQYSQNGTFTNPCFKGPYIKTWDETGIFDEASRISGILYNGIFIDVNGMLTINFIDLMGYQCNI